MKQAKVIKLHQVIEKLSKQDFPLPQSYKLFKIRKQLQPAIDFRLEQEQKLFEKHPIVEQQGGSVRFSTPEDAAAVETALREMADMEIDVNITPVTLPMLETITITPEELEILEGVIEWADSN